MYECRRCMTGDCSLGQYYCSFIRHWKRPPEDGASGRRSTVFASEGKCSALVGRRDWNILISADIQKGEVDNGSRKAPGMFRLYRYSRARDILEACRHEKWSCSRLFPGVKLRASGERQLCTFLMDQLYKVLARVWTRNRYGGQIANRSRVRSIKYSRHIDSALPMKTWIPYWITRSCNIRYNSTVNSKPNERKAVAAPRSALWRKWEASLVVHSSNCSLLSTIFLTLEMKSKLKNELEETS